MSQTFFIYPMNQELELEAGKTYQAAVNISNPADAEENFSYTVSVAPYSVMENGNEADLVTKSTASQIVDWITIEKPTGTLRPNESRAVYFTITVPTDAPGGGQYAAILVSSDQVAEVNEGLNINDTFEMASIVYATVSGETKHSGEVLSNNIPGFVTNGAPVLSAYIVNNGNVHEKAKVMISAKNVFTGEDVMTVSEGKNVFNEIVMPGTSRYVEREIKELPALGVFEVSQTVSYLGENSLNTATVIMCPIWFLLLVIATVGVIVGTIAGLIVRRKNRIEIF